MVRRFMLAFMIFGLAATLSHAALLPTGRGKIVGTVQEVHFSDPLQEPHYVLADVVVKNALGEIIILQVNRDTAILTPAMQKAYITYIAKGKKVKAEYEVRNSKNIARAVHIQK